MLMKLVLAYNGELGSMIRAGTILKWHKAEGEAINYGDDLFDLRVEEVNFRKELGEIDPSQIAGTAERSFQSGETSEDFHANEGRKRWIFFVRVTSSDSGILRRLYAQEGELLETGCLLAALSSSESEPIAADLKEASEFRVIVNAFDSPSSDATATWPRAGGVREKVTRGPNYVVLRAGSAEERRIGLYAAGGRYLNWMFACAPLIQPTLNGTCCIFREGALFKGLDGPPSPRSDLLLQSLRFPPEDQVAMVIDKVKARWEDFHRGFFDPTFDARNEEGSEEFPKTVVLLSIVPDIRERLFRHRTHGFLIYPGLWWFTSSRSQLDSIFSEENVSWFTREFESLGPLSVEESSRNLETLVRSIRQRTRAHVVIANALDTARGAIHNFQLADSPLRQRRHEFNLALAELSRKLDFPVVDIDRILKRAGIAKQVNWDQLYPDVNIHVARELTGILGELGILAGRGSLSSGEVFSAPARVGMED